MIKDGYLEMSLKPCWEAIATIIPTISVAPPRTSVGVRRMSA
jgi:hypothetical protein